MPTAHPPSDARPDLSVNPVFTRQPMPIPRYRLPDGELDAERRLPDRPRRADARRQRAAQPGHVRHDVDGAAGAAADGRVARQEHDRQGRVPAHRRPGAALRADARRPLERARPASTRSAARPPAPARRACSAGSRSSAAGSTPAARPGKPDRPARTSSWAPTSRSAGTSSPTTGTSSRASCRWRATGFHLDAAEAVARVRREHHRRRRDPRLDVRRQLRAGRRDLRRARRPAASAPASTSRSTSTARPAP